MEIAFAQPMRIFFRRQILPRTTSSHIQQRQNLITARITEREKRRAVHAARTNAHRDIKRELDRHPSLQSVIVSVPRFVRERCSLTPGMARVKVPMERKDMADLFAFKGKVRSGLVRLFPELEQRGLLRASGDFDFDMKVGGGEIVNDLNSLQQGLLKCERVASCVFVEVIPHKVPPPRPPLSPRVQQVSEKAAAAAQDPNMDLYMISFYKFVEIDRPDLVSHCLHKTWARMGIKGRVYVAKEGVNAQLSVPDKVLQDFRDAMDGSWVEVGETLIPTALVGTFLNVDRVVHHSEQPFQKLSVRPRDKVLADGFAEALDWNRAGKEISPEEWHKLVKDNAGDTIVLDCRNSYESAVGRFEGAEPLNTKTFRESWKQLEKRLESEPRNKRILTYCTGGIRCVKVNAFLEQKMGFVNTGRLEGGIVSYARTMREYGRLEESAFKGVNHVFDGRMGEEITSDLLDRCVNCNQPCNQQTDCANTACPRPFDERMFVQCEDCAAVMNGACSASCRDTLAESGVLPEKLSPPSSEQSIQTFVRDVSDSDRYADSFTGHEDPLLRKIRMQTEEQFPNRAHMLSSYTQASLLGLLIKIGSISRVLEIGTFTGYASLAMAMALPPNGKLVTCERDDTVLKVATEIFDERDDLSAKITLCRGHALDTIAKFVMDNSEPFDMAFIDADKGGYISYLDALLENNLVRMGGLLIFDNVLFRDEVPALWANGDDVAALPLPTEVNELVTKRLRNMENARKIAKKLHAFNQCVRDDSRLEQVLLPIRDGLTVARRIR